MLTHEDKTYCTACFTELAAEAAICPVCGYNGESSQNRYPIALPLGTILMGKYVIGRVLGKGGFGITYLAYNLKENQTVAIKEYYPDTLVHRNYGSTYVAAYEGERTKDFNLGAEKFYEEAKTVSRFNGHPNIINVYEFFYENNTAYFAMEYIRGVDLKNYIGLHGGRLSETDTIKLLMPVLDALMTVHSYGVLHRDISPDNIMVGEDGNVKLLDFGSARQILGQQSKSLSVILKPGFAPLEQYQSRGKQGPWTDIYSFAATMYYSLTGKVPDDCMNRVDEDMLILPSAMGAAVSGRFEDVLFKGMAVKIADRYQSAYQLKNDILSIPEQEAYYQQGTVILKPSLKQVSPIKAALPAEQGISWYQPPVNAAPLAGKTASLASYNVLRIILGVAAACVLIVGAVATAALLNNKSSSTAVGPPVSTENPAGTTIQGTIHSTTESPEPEPTDNSVTGPIVNSDDYITIKGEEYPTSLTELDLSDKGLNNSDIESLKDMVNLTSLTLGDAIDDDNYSESNSITDLTPLRSLSNLTELHLFGIGITDLSPLESLTKLTVLDLRSNGITDLAPLQPLTDVTKLWLSNNEITDITPIKSMDMLSILFLDFNSISDISTLRSLTRLTTLDLGNNSITDLTPIHSLTKLSYLYLNSNNIAEVSELKSLTTLTELQISNNGISAADIGELEAALPDCNISSD